MSALDAVIVLARYLSAAAIAAHDDAAFFGVDFDLVARQPRHFHAHDERGGGFIEVNRRGPARGVGPDQLSELLVQREEITERIPPRKGHARIVAWLKELGQYVLRLQGYTDTLWAYQYRPNGFARGN